MNIKLYHATSEENYLSIMENGFNPRLAAEMTWHCSFEQEVYFYDSRKIAEEFGSEDLGEITDECLRACFENAATTAAQNNSKSERLYCFEITIDETYVYDDTSAKNMALFASCVDIKNLSIDHITAVYRLDGYYTPSLRLFFLAQCKDNDLFNMPELAYIEAAVVNSIDLTNVQDALFIEAGSWGRLN